MSIHGEIPNQFLLDKSAKEVINFGITFLPMKQFSFFIKYKRQSSLYASFHNEAVMIIDINFSLN